jgi:hypothetical protein
MNPNIKQPDKPYVPPAPVAPKPYVPPKETPILKGFTIGPGPEGKNDTYTLWYIESKGEKIIRKELLEVCHFGIQEVLDAITNSAFDIFFLKMEPTP